MHLITIFILMISSSMNKPDHDRGDKRHFFRYGLGSRNIILRRERTTETRRRLASVATLRFLPGDGSASRSRPDHHRLPENRHREGRVGGAAANPPVGNDGQRAPAGRRVSPFWSASPARWRITERSASTRNWIPFPSNGRNHFRLDSYSAYELAWYTTAGFGGIAASSTTANNE